MAFSLRYGEPDWDRPPRQNARLGMSSNSEILEQPLSNKSYEELRYEATQKQWANKFVDLNTMAVSSGADTSFVNLKNLTDVVEVVVGQDDQQARWVIHQKLLTSDSDFAILALKNGFKEHDERVIRFPEESPEVFEQYVKYLYTGCILSFSLELVVQMYTLGDRLQSMKFANICYETIAKSTDPYSANQIKYIFDNTYPEDRVRKLCTSQVGKGVLAGRYSFSTLDEQQLLKDFMPDLMQGVIAAVAQTRRGNEKWYPNFSSDTPAPDPTTTSTTPIFGAPPPASTSAAPNLFASLFDNNHNNSNQNNSSSQTTGSLFASSNATSGTFSGGLFGLPTTTSGGSLFGASNQSAGGFGSASAAFGGSAFGTPYQSSSGFGSMAPPTSGPAKSLFGSQPHTSTTSGGGLFGTAPSQPVHNTGGLFRAVGTNPASGGCSTLGGNPQPASAFGGGTRSASGGLFSFTTTAPFGESSISRPTGVSPFGTPSHPQAVAGRSSLFGSQQPTSTGSSLFGNAQNSSSYLFGSAQPKSSNVFGAPAQPPATSSFGGFANSNSSGIGNASGVSSFSGFGGIGSSSGGVFGLPTSARLSRSLFGQPVQSQSLQNTSNDTQNSTAMQQTQPNNASDHTINSTETPGSADPTESWISATTTANNNTTSVATAAAPGDKTNGIGNTHPGTANTNPNPLPVNGNSTTSPFTPSWPANASAPPASSHASLPVFSPFSSLNSDPKLRTGRNDIPGLHVSFAFPTSAGSATNGQNTNKSGKSGSGPNDRFTPTASGNEAETDLEEINEDVKKGEEAKPTALGSSANDSKNGKENGGMKMYSAELAAPNTRLEETIARTAAQLEKGYVGASYNPLKSKGSSEMNQAAEAEGSARASENVAGTFGGGGSAPATTAEDSFEPANSTAAAE